MSAFFNNTTQPVMDGNIQNTPPVMMVPREEDRERFAALTDEMKAAKDQAEARKQQARGDFDRWAGTADRQAILAKLPTDKLQFHAALSEGQGRDIQATLSGSPIKVSATADPKWDAAGHVAAKAFTRTALSAIDVPGAGDFDKNQSFSCAAWVKLLANASGAIVARMDDQHDFRGWDLWVEGGKVGTHIVNKWPENALKTVTRAPITSGKWHHVCITYNGNANTSGVRVYVDGAAQPTADQANALKDTIRTPVPFKIGQRHSTSVLAGASMQDVRLYEKVLSAEEVTLLAQSTRVSYLLSRGAAQLAAGEKDELFSWWLAGTDEPYRTLAAKLATLQNEEKAIRAKGTEAHVMQEKSEDAVAYLLARGEYDKRKDKVTPLTPGVLPALPADQPKNRLGLAKWLVRPDHPLTARVTVNRFWQEVFGQGIVTTPGDFGVTGTLPTHPELLDWLSVEFREKNWDIKRFFKLLVTSATYRQSGAVTPAKNLKDPKNKLLSRGPRFRMDAEMVRDYALAASGLLVEKIGGPSVRPYQPPGVWEAVAMIGSNTRDYKQDKGENLYRRSMYTLWKRAAPPASMDIFNAPAREVCTVHRERTNTPLQALVTLNDIQYVEAARVLAQRALKDGGATPESRIDFLARRLLARPFRADETTVVKRSLADLTGFYTSHSKEAGELINTGESKPDAALKPETLAAWTMLTNQLLNLDEVLNK